MSTADELPVILLVSGSDFLINSIKRLAQDRFTLFTVADADQAWSALTRKNTISVILCELTIATNKSALLHRIRSSNRQSVTDLPVLVLAGESDEERLLDLAFAAGASDYIELPFSSDEFNRRIRMHTGKYLQAFENATHQLEDSMTTSSVEGLLQQNYFISRLDEEISFSRQHQFFVGCAILKIDGMDNIAAIFGKNIRKPINHVVAGIIGKQIRGEDAFCHLGQHTFGILYPVTNALSTQVAVRRVLSKIQSANFQFDGKKIPITASAGLYATIPGETLDSKQVMKKLQARLKQTEGLGGNKIVNSKAESEQEVVSLEKGLRYIRTKQEDRISGQLPHLLNSVYPLLAFARQQDRSAFDTMLNKLGN